MKLIPVFFAALFAAGLGVSTVAVAQQQPAPPPAHMRALRGVTLTDAQRQQIDSLMQSYRQAHPQGSSPDPQGRKALMQQIMAVLTPDQRAQVKANREQMRQAHQEQEQEQGQQPPPPQPQATN